MNMFFYQCEDSRCNTKFALDYNAAVSLEQDDNLECPLCGNPEVQKIPEMDIQLNGMDLAVIDVRIFSEMKELLTLAQKSLSDADELFHRIMFTLDKLK